MRPKCLWFSIVLLCPTGPKACGLMAQFQVPSLPDMAYHEDILWGFAVSLIWSSWCLEHLQIFRGTGSFLVVTLSYHWRLVKFLLFWLTVDCGFATLYRNLFWRGKTVVESRELMSIIYGLYKRYTNHSFKKTWQIVLKKKQLKISDITPLNTKKWLNMWKKKNFCYQLDMQTIVIVNWILCA